MQDLLIIKKFYGGIFVNKEKLSSEGINYPIKIEYYKICDSTENREITQYGIEVVKTEYRNNNVNIENKEITNITKDEKEINNILDKLKIYQVTPVVAKYIIEDIMYNKQKIN